MLMEIHRAVMETLRSGRGPEKDWNWSAKEAWQKGYQQGFEEVKKTIRDGRLRESLEEIGEKLTPEERERLLGTWEEKRS